MAGAKHLPGHGRAQLPAWYYLSGNTIVNPDDEALVLPSRCDTITLSTETGPCYYSINGVASVNSGGYIPTDGMQTVGPIANLTSFNIHSPAGSVHVMFWREA